MDCAQFQLDRKHRFDPPGDPQGVSFDDDGPMLGRIRLLAKRAGSFSPRPVDELNEVMSRTFGQPLDCGDLLPGLRVIATALNEESVPRAMIATLLMRLPVLDEVQARRAAAVEALCKASPDDPKHPGWPAKTPDGRGGQFRPKDAEVSDEAKSLSKKRLARLVRRRLIRDAITRFLKVRRIFRIGAEVASNAVPVLDAAADAAMAVDLGDVATEMGALKRDADAAFEFASKGPHELESLKVSPKEETFSSFDAFKKEDFTEEELVKRFGPAGDGYEYHHIVEQSAKGDIPVSAIQSTRNIIRIPKLVHEEINSIFSTNDRELDGNLRSSLEGKTFEERRAAGLKTLWDLGVISDGE